VKGRVVVAAAVAALAGGSTASAGDVFAGYSYLRREGESLHGGGASLTLPLQGSLRLSFEITSHQGRVDDKDHSEWALLVGPTFLRSREARIRPFAHVKAGVLRRQSEVGVFGVAIDEEGVCEGSCPGDVGFVAEAGGGLDWHLKGAWLLRLPQVDYRYTRQEGDNVSGFRASGGVVFRWGR
jgi:hypothetical protein